MFHTCACRKTNRLLSSSARRWSCCSGNDSPSLKRKRRTPPSLADASGSLGNSMTRLILMRHGATEANLQRPYTLQGRQPDSELAPAGIVQAHAAAASLQSFGIDSVCTSPLRRARATAEVIAGLLRFRIEVVDGLI